jgi:hypothetical protein
LVPAINCGHLPRVDVEAELQRLSDIERRKEFRVFASSPLRRRVEEKLLARQRLRRGDPEWRPTGFLSGGGLVFHSMVERRMWQLWIRELHLMQLRKSPNLIQGDGSAVGDEIVLHC